VRHTIDDDCSITAPHAPISTFYLPAPMINKLLRMVLASRFVQDAAKLSSGVFVAQVIAFATSPFLTRLFTPEAFGTYSIIFAIATVASVFCTLRLETLLPIVDRPGTAIGLLSFIIIISGGAATAALIAIAAFGPQIAQFYGIEKSQAPLLFAIPVLIIITSSYLSLRYWLIRKRRFSAIGRSQVLRALLNAGVSLVMGVMNFPAQFPTLGLIAGQAAGDAMFGGQLAAALRKRELLLLLRPRMSRIFAELRRRQAQITTLFATQAVAVLYGRLPLIVIGVAFGPIHVGWYALAERICQAPSALVASAIGDVYRQRASEAFRAGKPFDALMRRVLGLTTALSIVPFAFAIALATSYTGLLFGEKWHDAGSTVAIMLIGTFFAFNQSPVDKAALIHEANGYIYAWHGIRLVGECAAGWLAYKGHVGYIGYLSLVVAIRAGLAIWDLAVEHALAKKVSRRANLAS
jgi:O-antigen/teichoic acid export membrane protein